MRPNILCLILFIGLGLTAHAQFSLVADIETKEPIPFANIKLQNRDIYFKTDSLGKFSFNDSLLNQHIIISAYGYKQDTVLVKTSNSTYYLSNATNLKTLNISSRKKTSNILFASSIQIENIDEKELYKAACCNLAESFETNPSIDASFSDGATGSKNIKLLGLGGKYALLSVENMPRIRGNGLINGLNSIPGTWVESIQILKGNSSVANGFEGLSGQINVELKGLEDESVQELNLYTNSFARWEANGVNQLHNNNTYKAALLWNASGWSSAIDKNNDGFYEMPKVAQKNFVLSQNFSPSPKFHNDINLTFNENKRNGGSVDSSFPLTLNDQNIGLFGKSGYVLSNTGKSIGFQYSYNQYDFDGTIGNKDLASKTSELYLNLIHQNFISNTNHIIKVGASLLKEKSEDTIEIMALDTSMVSNNFDRNIPGVFAEYNGTLSENDNLTLGLRTDYYQTKWIVSPRLNYRHAFNSKTVFRTGIGRAFRSNYLVAEHYSMMINNRNIVGQENLSNPEESWSMFSSIWRKFKIGYREGNVLIEHHYQQFQNRVLSHYIGSDVLDLRKHSKATNHSFLIQINYEIIPKLDLKIAYKYNDQKATDVNGGFNNIWLLPHNRSFINLSYETRNEWLFNTTLNRIGRQTLPDAPISDIANRGEVDAFYLLNFQVSKTWKKWRFYSGAENIFNAKQDNAWLGLSEGKPEASIAWQSPIGRLYFVGVNYTLKKKPD
jgi:outer membrane receptor for ferrienterochelin and colicin